MCGGSKNTGEEVHSFEFGYLTLGLNNRDFRHDSTAHNISEGVQAENGDLNATYLEVQLVGIERQQDIS